ncbi:2-deoxyglucose-6-phosphate hydrolase YniC [Klebsiella pneumoniae]|nr:2-deoxyglucose-6-phosphate hydrolase YniC [Klebsiella pneumoniae]
MVLNAFDLTGKVAIVTGCDTGLGQGMTLGLAQAGCDIVGINRKIPHDTAAQVLALGRRFHAIQADLSQENDMSGLVDQAVAAMGRVDILVNNAGIIRRHDALTFTESDWDAVIDLNLKAVFFLSQAVARQFIRQGEGGKIINIASMLVDTRRRDELPDLLGLRIDLVVDLWYAQQPWHGVDRAEATARIIRRAIELVEASRPLLPGVREAVALCKAQGLKVGLASASPLMMLEKVLDMFELRDQFDALASAEHLPWSKPHPQVYLNCAAALGVDPQRCVALEDSVNGMIASKAARMRSIVVPEAENSRDPRFALADVKLPSLLALTAENLLG